MQTSFTHHLFWTVLATLGVILSAAYVLTMIQRVFYSDLGPKPATVQGWDLDAREHIALWPMVLLFLVMGVAPSFWLRAIDTVAAPMASQPAGPGLKYDGTVAASGAGAMAVSRGVR